MKKTINVLTDDQHALLRNMVKPLLSWYDSQRRILPWREDPAPYRVWLSEIMLQQTRVEAGKPYFERFMRELPTIGALAAVDDERLMKLWEGLGYYNRARNLKKAAQVIMDEYGGEVPADFEKIKSLPGIGSYTAGAIASIAFNIAKPAVDGNVLRVASRVLASDESIEKPEVKAALEEALEEVMPRDRAGDFNQSLMELGALVCLPNGKARCESCPISAVCKANELGLQVVLPVKEKKKPRRLEEKTVLLLCCEDKVALQKRPEKGLLAGLWEFPSLEGLLTPQELKKQLEAVGSPAEKIEPLTSAVHIFTHVQWNMIGYRVNLSKPAQNSAYIWVKTEQLDHEYAVPSAFSAYRALLS